MTHLSTNTEAVKESASTTKRQRVMAFELQTGGHHPSYIRNFAEQWVNHSLPADIDFVVTPQFFKLHADVVESVNNLNKKSIRIHSISDEEDQRLQSNLFLPERYGWKLFCDYARKLNADRALLMYSDYFQLPIILGQSSPCPFSCIYFRPTFHYSQFANYRPDIWEKLKAFRKKILLKQMLKIKQLEVLFCLDPIVVEYILQNFNTHAQIRRIPDYFARHKTPPGHIEELRSELGIERGRTVLSLVGSLDHRKGPQQLLAAIENLAPDIQNKLCLLLVGKLNESIANEVLTQIQKLKSSSNVQVILQDKYILDSIFQEYYELSDVALITYQQHMGMSASLIRAGIAGIPVLASDYGLIGELVLRNSLGLSVDTKSSQSLTRAIEKVLSSEPKHLFNAEKARAFANQHSSENLAKTLADWLEMEEIQ